MALNLSTIKAGKTTMPARKGSIVAKDRGPNVFLDKTFPQNLENSYEKKEAYFIQVAGHMEKGVYQKGKDKGKPTERLAGDAADAIFLLRKAAEELDLGVSIDYQVLATPKGQVKITYQAGKRKVFKPKTPAPVAAPVATPAAEVPAAETSATA